MNEPRKQVPYKSLGALLKRMREKHRESLAEVSGAVEIDMEVLSAIENGLERPSEDILLLLISHFGLKEEEASRLWKLAKYEQSKLPSDPMINDENSERPAVMVMPMDVRINYTDMVHVMVNNYGVVMNFMQGAGPNSQPLIISRVGMSREHAQSVLELLQRTLAQSEPKSLPAPKNPTDDIKQ